MSNARATQNAPPGWRTVRFDQFAENIAERVDPAEADVEYYVGLEHLDPESLKIRRWGTPDDVKGTKLRFRKSDIIFGRRRFYQRKLAVAEFDGICSAHAMVLRACEGVMLQDLLPFFLQSETFFQRAMQISVGSLSPTINWRILARQEFTIPPLDEQRRIAEILWAADDVVTKTENALERLESALSSVFEAAVTSGLKQRNQTQAVPNTPSWKQVRLGELLGSAQYGTSKRSSSVRESGTVPVLRIPNVVTGELDLSDLKWMSLTDQEQERYSADVGDVLVVRTNGNPLYVGRSVAIKTVPERTVFASYLIRLRVDQSRILPAYLSTLLNSRYLRKTLRHEIRSSAGNYNINTKGLQRQNVPLPPIREQGEILENIQEFNNAKAQLEKHIQASRLLKSRLLNQLLS